MYRKYTSSVLFARPAEMVRLSSMTPLYSYVIISCLTHGILRTARNKGWMIFTNSVDQISYWEAMSLLNYQLIKFYILILFNKICHSILPWTRWIQCTLSHFTYFNTHFNVIIHLRLGLASSIFPSCIWITIFPAFLVSFMLPTCSPISFSLIWLPL
jgi:hypothetical protein